jgi:predicted TIM-barrel fold metal-dependent hydrolase
MAKSKFPWLKLPKKTDPEYVVDPPIPFLNHSNGEYFHQQTKQEAKMRKEIFRRADDQSRFLGLDRREFLASSMGMATTLAVINQMGCNSTSDEASNVQPIGDDPFALGDGPYVIPPEATCEASDYLDQEYFIMDVQTHAFDHGEWREKNTAYPIFARLIARCTDEDEKLDCFDQNHYAELMFVDSETSLSVITSWPAAQCFAERNLLGNSALACGLPLSNEGMRDLRDWLNSKAMSQRVINQVQVMPNDMIELQIEGMYASMEDPKWRAGSWKAYPAWRSDTYPGSDGTAQGYFLTDPVGVAFIEAGLKLGVPNFAVHKGLPIPGFDVEHNQPTDVGPIAKMFPQANFVIYHSGINAGTGGNVAASLSPERTEDVPYASTGDVKGVNQLIRSLISEGLVTEHEDGTVERIAKLNVYAEMGSAWSQCMGDPNMAQHYIGKLLKYLGPDNIVWGTDCILGGSPAGQIAAFKTFSITPEYQDKYGYPELTKEMKAKIFGLNAAKIYRIDSEAARCKVTDSSFAMYKRELDGELGTNRWQAKRHLGPRTRREFMALAKWNKSKNMPG